LPSTYARPSYKNLLATLAGGVFGRGALFGHGGPRRDCCCELRGPAHAWFTSVASSAVHHGRAPVSVPTTLLFPDGALRACRPLRRAPSARLSARIIRQTPYARESDAALLIGLKCPVASSARHARTNSTSSAGYRPFALDPMAMPPKSHLRDGAASQPAFQAFPSVMGWAASTSLLPTCESPPLLPGADRRRSSSHGRRRRRY